MPYPRTDRAELPGLLDPAVVNDLAAQATLRTTFGLGLTLLDPAVVNDLAARPGNQSAEDALIDLLRHETHTAVGDQSVETLGEEATQGWYRLVRAVGDVLRLCPGNVALG